MATEGTPLVITEDQKKAGIKAVGDKLKAAGGALMENAKGLVEDAKQGKATMNILVVAGGIAVVITSVLALFSDLLSLNIVGFLIEILLIGGGTVAVILEGGEKMAVEGFNEFVEANIKILTCNSGRAVFYLLLGLLKLSQVRHTRNFSASKLVYDILIVHI